MELKLVCQGRQVSGEELDWLRQWIAEHRQWSRKRLARELCLEWDWRNERGQIKDFAARAFLESSLRAACCCCQFCNCRGATLGPSRPDRCRSIGQRIRFLNRYESLHQSNGPCRWQARRRPSALRLMCSAAIIWGYGWSARTSNTWSAISRAGIWLVCFLARRPGGPRRGISLSVGIQASGPPAFMT